MTPPLDLTITASAEAVIAREALRSLDGLETGGILLGHHIADGIHIRHAGDPGPNAVRGRDRFNRDGPHAQGLANVAWAADQSEWIGEWHTHPNADLAPSAIDLRSYVEHLNDADLNLHHFVAIIVGITPQSAPTAVTWLIDTNQAVPVQLRRSDDQ